MDKIYTGDALEALKTLESESVDSCITSPPYWCLRDYGTAKWEGGDDGCKHTINDPDIDPKKVGVGRPNRQNREVCLRCGAKRIDAQLGLEKTPEPMI